MVLGTKYPLMINLCNGAIGAFVGMIDISSEKDHVKIKYVPLNGLRPKITSESYPKTNIARIIPDNTKIPGVMRDYVVIFENANGEAPFLDKIKEDVLDKIAKFKEEVRVKELEAVQQKYRAREAKEESAKQLAREQELSSIRRKRPSDLFGGMPGRMDRFRDYIDEEEYL